MWNNYKKVLFIWFLVVVDNVILVALREQLVTHFIVAVIGVALSLLFFLTKNKKITNENLEAFSLAFKVGFAIFIIYSAIFIEEAIKYLLL